MSFITSLRNYLNASYPALWIQTHEEVRICREIYEAFKKSHKVFFWDCQEGLSRRTDKQPEVLQNTKTPEKMFESLQGIVASSTDENIFILKDFHLHINSPLKKAEYIRSLKNSFPMLKAKCGMVIILAPVIQIPLELTKDIQVLDYALPDEAAINERLTFIHDSANRQKKVVLTDEIRESAVEAAKGLTFAEVESAFALGIITHKEFGTDFVSTVFNEKIQQIKKGGLLTYLEPNIDFANVGGLEGIKSWIKVRRNGYSKAARDFGLPYPKGYLAAGIPGCGKTLLAKATAREFGFPLFQVDIGRLFDKFVGGTENNFIQLIKTVEGVGRCVLLLDEIEKYLNEDAVSGAGDSGTSSRSFGTLLSWLSDRESPIFIIATSNDHTRLPSALKRKGRFDEMFWVDLPSDKEREDICKVVIRKYKRDPKQYDIKELTKATKGFTGVEVDEAYKNALYTAFSNGVEINTALVLDEAKKVVPQSKLDEGHFASMREQAKTLTPASSLPVSAATVDTRKLKL